MTYSSPPREQSSCVRRQGIAAIVFAALCLSPPVLAQEQTDEDVIELSPFTVDTSGDMGYLSQSTLAGSRLNTKLKDTAASISVFTPEFLDDIAAFTVEDALAYSINGEVDYADTQSDVSGGNSILENSLDIRIRGVKASLARNFFAWSLKTDNYNVERIDESRGPNSILFGIGSPGGILNTSTKKAMVSKNFGKVTVSVGDDGLRRGTLDLTAVVKEGMLAVRFNALESEYGTFRRFEETQQTNYHGAITFRPTNSTVIQAEFETSDTTDTRARPYTAYDRSSLWTEMGSTIVDTSSGGSGANGGLGIARFNNNNNFIVAIDDGGEVENFRGFMTSNTDNARRDTIYVEPGFDDNAMNLTGPNARRNMDFETYTIIAQQRIIQCGARFQSSGRPSHQL